MWCSSPMASISRPISCGWKAIATNIPSSASSPSTRRSPPTLPTISRRPGAIAIASNWASRTRRWRSIAADMKLSAKYLPMVWAILHDKDAVGPVAKLRPCGMRCPRPMRCRVPAQLRRRRPRRMREFRHPHPRPYRHAVRFAHREGAAGPVGAAAQLAPAGICRQSPQERSRRHPRRQ